MEGSCSPRRLGRLSRWCRKSSPSRFHSWRAVLHARGVCGASIDDDCVNDETPSDVESEDSVVNIDSIIVGARSGVEGDSILTDTGVMTDDGRLRLTLSPSSLRKDSDDAVVAVGSMSTCRGARWAPESKVKSRAYDMRGPGHTNEGLKALYAPFNFLEDLVA